MALAKAIDPFFGTVAEAGFTRDIPSSPGYIYVKINTGEKKQVITDLQTEPPLDVCFDAASQLFITYKDTESNILTYFSQDSGETWYQWLNQ